MVNPTSGGNRGEEFLKVTPMPFPVPLHHEGAIGKPKKALLYIYSMKDGEAGKKPGFKKMLDIVKQLPVGDRLKVIVGGGDGSVMWADYEATTHGIDTAKSLVYGIIPLGTGNDFSRVAGWGSRNPKNILKDDCKVVKSYVTNFFAAEIRPHDVWEVTIEADKKRGKILHVQSDKTEGPVKDGALSYTSNMINYFSIGQECKAGVVFEKHRTKSQTCNLFVYAFSGIVTEAQCSSTQHVGDLVSGLYNSEDSRGRCVLSCHDENNGPELVKNPESILFLNVNSYAGGNAHFWDEKMDRFGVEPRPEEEVIGQANNPGDQKLEVVTLPQLAEIPLDRAHHWARRVFQGAPFFLEFWEHEDDDMDAYCEVDGEFLHLVNPESVKISLKKTLQVLQRDAEDEEELLSDMSDEDE